LMKQGGKQILRMQKNAIRQHARRKLKSRKRVRRRIGAHERGAPRQEERGEWADQKVEEGVKEGFGDCMY